MTAPTLIAPSALTRVGYIAETTPGTTPSTPVFLPLRVTGAGIRPDKTTQAIRELSQYGNVPAEVQTGQSGSAAYQFALSYGTFDDIIAAALNGTWATNVVKNGTVFNSFTFEETIDYNASFGYARLVYGLIDTFSLSIGGGKGIDGSFSIKGQKVTLATAIISGATYTAPNTNTPMGGGVAASLSVASLSSPLIKSLSIDIKNSIRPQPVIDSLYPGGFGQDLIDVTGTVEIYSNNNAALQAVLDHGGGSISATIGSTTSQKYTIAMSTVTFLDGARQIGGTSADVIYSIPFRATGSDNTSNPSIQITRAVA